MAERPTSIIVCINDRYLANKPSCARGGSVAIADALEQGIAERGLPLAIERLHCLGECTIGPNLRIAPGGRFYHHVRLAQVSEILDELERLLNAD